MLSLVMRSRADPALALTMLTSLSCHPASSSASDVHVEDANVATPSGQSAHPELLRAPTDVVPTASASSASPYRDQQPSSLRVRSRAEWGASPPAPSRMVHNTRIQYVTIHHTAEQSSRSRPEAAIIRGIQRFHQVEKQWGDVAYHYFVTPTGDLFEGRDPRLAADTATRYDPRGHITVSMLGNFEVEEATLEAKSALVRIVAALLTKHDLPVTAVRLHRDVAATACPGKSLIAFLKGPGMSSLERERTSQRWLLSPP